MIPRILRILARTPPSTAPATGNPDARRRRLRALLAANQNRVARLSTDMRNAKDRAERKRLKALIREETAARQALVKEMLAVQKEAQRNQGAAEASG